MFYLFIYNIPYFDLLFPVVILILLGNNKKINTIFTIFFKRISLNFDKKDFRDVRDQVTKGTVLLDCNLFVAFDRENRPLGLVWEIPLCPYLIVILAKK